MSDTEDKMLMAFFWTLVIAMIVCIFGAGYSAGCGSTSQKAIEAGVARYTVDEKTGATKFEWITPEGKE